jgi:hypothetical protein
MDLPNSRFVLLPVSFSQFAKALSQQRMELVFLIRFHCLVRRRLAALQPLLRKLTCLICQTVEHLMSIYRKRTPIRMELHLRPYLPRFQAV